jgi:uncharacterized protein (DUF1499 family)
MNFNTYTRFALMLSCVVLVGSCSSVPGKPAGMQALPECGVLPNCVNTRSGSGLHASEPFRANARQWQKLKSWIARQDGRGITADDENFIRAVVKTPVTGLRDDVQLLHLPDLQLIQVASSSRLGLSDPGTNARRGDTLREQFEP